METKYIIIAAVVVLVLFLALPLVSTLKGGNNVKHAAVVDNSKALEMVTANVQGMSFACTAIGAAILRGDKDRVDAFLKAGANINARLKVQAPNIPEFYTYAICMAIEAIAMGEADIGLLRFMLDNGADPNVSFERSYPSGNGGTGPVSISTPLATAFSADRVDVMELLLSRGADPNVRIGNKGQTVLKVAVAMRKQATADLLRKYGAIE